MSPGRDDDLSLSYDEGDDYEPPLPARLRSLADELERPLPTRYVRPAYARVSIVVHGPDGVTVVAKTSNVVLASENDWRVTLSWIEAGDLRPRSLEAILHPGDDEPATAVAPTTESG